MAYPKPFPLASPPTPQQAAFAPDLSVRLICPDCRVPNTAIIEEFGAGDLVCRGCGQVHGDRVIDTRSEWRVRASHFFSTISSCCNPILVSSDLRKRRRRRPLSCWRCCRPSYGGDGTARYHHRF